MKARAVLVPVVLLTAAASAAILLRSDAVVNPGAAAPPVTMASGTSGTLTLGDSLTSGSVTHALGIGQAAITGLHGGSQDWKARIELQSATGIGPLDAFTLSVCRSGCDDQIIVSSGTTTQTTGTPRTIPASTTDATISISGTKASLEDTVFTTQVVMTPDSASAPEVRYDYAVTVRTI